MNDTEIIPVPTENKSDSETNEQIIESSTEPNIDDSVVIENNEETSEDLATDIPPSYRGIGYFFRRILSFVLSSATILTVGITFFSAAQSIEINKTTLTRQLIGEFVGGMKNVYAEEPRNSYPLLSPPPPDGLEMIEKIPMPEDLAENQMPSDGSSPLILARDLSSTAEGSLGIINETPYTPDLEKLLSAKRVIPYADSLYDLYGEKKPVVLILHTHATEAFADQFAGGFRSNDTTKNIVSVGAILAEKLNEAGIVTIHATDLLDSPDFNLAYYNAAQLIRAAKEKYPSISYIFDIHRDAIESGGICYSPTTYIGSTPTAQLMFVVGTDHGGSGHTTWQNNLALAVRLQSAIADDHPTLMRDINLRSASFNEQYSDGSLLIEVGSGASSLEEAKSGIKVLAEYLIQEIRGY